MQLLYCPAMLHSYYKNDIITCCKMSFVDKINEVRGSNEIFVASIVKISTFNKDVLDSEWTLINRALRLVCIGQTDRVDETMSRWTCYDYACCRAI